MDRILNAVNYITSFLAGDYNITKFNSPIKETICGFDGFINLKFNSSSQVSKYSVQFGDFSSYNKVLQPTNIEITLCTKGSFEKIAAVVSTLDNYKNSTVLIDIQTPYGVYIGYNITDFNYELSAEKGVGYVECVINVRQIEVSSAQFTAFRNIEEKPTTLLGKFSLVQSSLEKVENVITKVTKTVLGTELIFGNKLRWRI